MSRLDYTEVADGERWESFTRDFLQEMGLTIESPPARGSDLGKDLLVSEHLSGSLGNQTYRWLVSCKHFAGSSKSVGVDDELDIPSRVDGFKAAGFLGFYSTLPSSSLRAKVEQLKEAGRLKGVQFFDGAQIESLLITKGMSILMARYFPKSYVQIRPAHLLFGKYYPLECEVCGKDLLFDIEGSEYKGNVILAYAMDGSDRVYKRIFVDCKSPCDAQIKEQLRSDGMSSSWYDIGDLMIPAKFIDWILSILGGIRSGKIILSDEAFEDLSHFLGTLSQRVLREMTAKDVERFNKLIRLGF